MKKYCFGIDVGGTTVKMGLFTTEGELLDKWEIPTRKEDGGAYILNDVAASVEAKLAEKNIEKEDVAGAGIGVPGPTLDTGYVSICVNLGWKDKNPANELSELLSIPVKAGNDANVAALGEMWKGGGEGYLDVVLLTLGTGFDVELTAKENVYLNGAIIGYSKEFIDSKYDEIVKFAELEGFMEEKVKNFSSGMVSRLGFAIATIGETAEILILDEVLSVGDEFFQKKSLKRVKQMIHGGSTVLLVSHSMPTIRENCTKVVWIEKGKLKMIGEPKVICEAYRKMSERGIN